MTTYKVDKLHKIEVSADKQGFTVKLFEKIGGKWAQLGAEESWYSLDDIKWEYGID